MTETIPCALCGRPFAPRQLTRHHCLPRQEGGTSDHVELICAQCHGMVHATYTNETLAARYSTIDRLRKAPELQPFLRWVRKQPPSRRKTNRPRRRKL
ncbi:MAG TPA: HNH endonuclease [Gemmataceae bacterium]|jgi:5-methylcytosine-specific restriction endonuclease McrA|nr:HNH endonuclease [Gemmataceae bacterium]